MMKIDMEYVLRLLRELMDIPSVAGDCRKILDRTEREFLSFGLPVKRTRKGALLATMKGRNDEEVRLVSAHVDTLGAVVREIKPNGRLRLLQIGGFAWTSFETENLVVRTASGRDVRGSLLPEKASIHAFSDTVRETLRTDENMEVRLDEPVSSPEDVRALGIEVGDFVFFDPRYEVSESGFVKSRFLDDKACVAFLFGAIKAVKDSGIPPAHTTVFYLTNYEEHGHGISCLPENTAEHLALDVGIVAPPANSREDAVTIVARDSRTPYDFAFRKFLSDLAAENNVPYRVDTHFRYGSDASLAAVAGFDANFACFGPGVDASHSYERTTIRAVEASGELLAAYLASERR
ncbi:MAG TPA: M42 family metallopeptidase [Aminivibrio sp.]|jgi:putative aminopeptidase FrvX|uniref:M42 family metallopeptidase n=1 Tax=Aminivibrio sp. TaxID=1872489 RepID=UPI002B1F4A52|nr:M42 family metallopeptidase [Aminivibrio sp.]MDD3515355.1 M42 family metallopeptidase [Synergistaceae bacterium]MEA4952444.1 M42 family metallopeptidase [Aminivibrio sp.]HPF86112.1 M42 family metallopeptidase [Aminivibrio sp.]